MEVDTKLPLLYLQVICVHVQFSRSFSFWCAYCTLSALLLLGKADTDFFK